MKRKNRTTCGEYIADRVAVARDRKVEELFSSLEAQALRERLSIDAAQREGEKQ